MKSIIFAYPARGNEFYAELSRRCAEELRHEAEVTTESYESLVARAERLDAQTLVVLVDPAAALETAPDLALDPLRRFSDIVLMTSECVQTNWFRRQFDLGVEFSLVLDVGFVAQEPTRDVGSRYAFVFNAPTASEAALLRRPRATTRPIEWVIVGHLTPCRAGLAEELTTLVPGRSLVFLPPLEPVRVTSAMMGSKSLARVLRAARFYVWRTHHHWPYFESFRFLDAVLNGAMPIKIERDPPTLVRSIPGVLGSASDLAGMLGEESRLVELSKARDYVLAHGTLKDQLTGALESYVD